MTDRTIAWPLARDAAGRLVTITPGSDAHARQAASILALTRQGDRITKPKMGTPDPVGHRSYDRAALQAAVDRWAPFAEVVDVDAIIDETGVATVTVIAKARSRT